RVHVVHDHMDRNDCIEGLAWRVVAGTYPEDDEEAEERVHREATRSIEAAFGERGVREGYAAALQLVPEKRRCELIGRVAKPWPADVYLDPDAPEEV
ncbi:MAG: hypothetical protein HKP30_02885, partial [Myxococcales bacterium]|nr:hypothetical protein [Myxococcales bacterium]